jgi:hypothetical protein
MPFVSYDEFKSMGEEKSFELFRTATILGMHPEEPDSFFLPDQDRYSGVYVLGVQGVGKSSLLENMISSD